jgi:hypothetical protein
VTWQYTGLHGAQPGIADKDEAAGSSPARPTILALTCVNALPRSTLIVLLPCLASAQRSENASLHCLSSDDYGSSVERRAKRQVLCRRHTRVDVAGRQWRIAMASHWKDRLSWVGGTEADCQRVTGSVWRHHGRCCVSTFEGLRGAPTRSPLRMARCRPRQDAKSCASVSGLGRWMGPYTPIWQLCKPGAGWLGDPAKRGNLSYGAPVVLRSASPEPVPGAG